MPTPTLVQIPFVPPARVDWPPPALAPTPGPQPLDLALPKMGTALLRGLRGQCPACGKGRIFARYLKVTDTCAVCAAPLGAVRADDAPPYFTILVTGHVVVPGMLWLEKAYAPPLWVHSAIWLPLTIALTMLLIQPIKGATLALMLKLGMVGPVGNG